MEKSHGISEKAQNNRRHYDFNASLLQTTPCRAGQIDCDISAVWRCNEHQFNSSARKRVTLLSEFPVISISVHRIITKSAILR